MKTLFSVSGKSIWLVDKEKRIFSIGNGKYCDIYGDPAQYTYERAKDLDDHECYFWGEYWTEEAGTSEPLVAVSTVELTDAAPDDEGVGLFGFQNEEGTFVIEPQYAFARNFSRGLAAVNLKRTWSSAKNGRRYYEDHFGYINEKGTMVIPFIYNEAYSFNKYGVALVCDTKYHLIDMSGNDYPSPEKYRLAKWYEYDDRFIEIFEENDYVDDVPGLYDIKKQKVLFEPMFCFVQLDNEKEVIRGSLPDNYYGSAYWHDHFYDFEGKDTYDWLNNKGFGHIGFPNKQLLSVVSTTEFKEYSMDENPKSYFSAGGKKYYQVDKYGVYDPSEHFAIPMKYDKIDELDENLYACYKNGTISVIEV